MAIHMVNGQIIGEQDLINLLEVDGDELIDLCRQPGFLTGKRLGVALSRFSKIDDAKNFLNTLGIYNNVGDFLSLPTKNSYLDLFSFFPRSQWSHILSLPGVIVALGKTILEADPIDQILLKYDKQLRLDFLELPPLAIIFSQSSYFKRRQKFLIDQGILAPPITTADLIDALSDFPSKNRWSLLLSDVLATACYVESIATGRAGKLFIVLEDFPSDKVLLQKALKVTQEGYRQFDLREGLSEAQYKKFHFFHPVCQDEPRPFLDKLRARLEENVSVCTPT